jgi:hypothetical protein
MGARPRPARRAAEFRAGLVQRHPRRARGFHADGGGTGGAGRRRAARPANGLIVPIHGAQGYRGYRPASAAPARIPMRAAASSSNSFWHAHDRMRALTAPSGTPDAAPVAARARSPQRRPPRPQRRGDRAGRGDHRAHRALPLRECAPQAAHRLFRRDARRRAGIPLGAGVSSRQQRHHHDRSAFLGR